MTTPKPFPVTPIPARGAPRSAIELAREHKEKGAAHGAGVARQLIAEIQALEGTASAALELGDYVPPGVRQAASDLQRELKGLRERLEAILSRGAA